MCSHRILRELVMHMLVSTNGVDVYGEVYIHKDTRKTSLTSLSRVHSQMYARIPLRYLDLSDVRKEH